MGKPIKKEIKSGDAPERTPRGATRLRKAKMANAAGWDFLNRLTFGRGWAGGPFFNRLTNITQVLWILGFSDPLLKRENL